MDAEINATTIGLDTSYFDEHFESIEEILQYLTFAL
jgi:hypothetical protein